MTQPCRESGCDRTDLSGRGLCSKHYQQHRFKGDLDEVAPRAHTVCVVCGDPLPSTDPRAMFCSTRCKESDRKRRRQEARIHQRETCEQCGTSITHLRTDARFCSEKCGDAWHNGQRSVERWAEIEGGRKPCEGCGGPIPAGRAARTRFCTDECKRDWRRKRDYGLTPEEHDALFARQDEACAICGADTAGGRGQFHIDHDHDTGKVRGLLCHKCNVGVGHFDDDPARLRAAADYLERPLD